MSQTNQTMRYTVREVVGIFATPEALQAAVDELLKAGVTRAEISVLGTNPTRFGSVETLYRSAEAIADDPKVHRETFVSSDSQTEGKTVAVGLPVTLGVFAGAWAVAAAGGALVAALGATLVGGAVGAGVGALLLRAVAREHADTAHRQLEQGASILWVSTPDPAAEERAMDILQRCGGTSVHAHEIEREWGTREVPLHAAQPDPLLEPAPEPTDNATERPRGS